MLAPYMMILALSILLIATSAIGIQCYNTANKEDTNKQFLIAMLAVAIFGLFASSFGIYLNK